MTLQINRLLNTRFWNSDSSTRNSGTFCYSFQCIVSAKDRDMITLDGIRYGRWKCVDRSERRRARSDDDDQLLHELSLYND